MALQYTPESIIPTYTYNNKQVYKSKYNESKVN